ncbi:DUF1634 domain-containing protein [Salmonella enterica subsp. enterica]|nr:DUF1634 domain-containing protein [Salmonella enterica subsp. enterica]
MISRLLGYGTGFACILISAGLSLAAVGFAQSYCLVQAGIAAFIFLPVIRVALMLVFFLRERDTVYILMAAIVLVILATSTLIA